MATRNVVRLVLGLLTFAAALSSYYQIEPEQVGLITRFGRYVRTSQPGPHFKLPFGAEQLIRVPVQRQLKEEFGFRTVRAGVRTVYGGQGEGARESRMLTGDLNVADVEWIVQYKIKDAYKFVFRVRDVRGTFRDMSEAVMRQTVGDRSVTEVLTVGRESIQIEAKGALQALCDRYDIGIEVLQLVLQDVNPPEPVRESFNEVNQAIQERERAINQAWARYNSIIPEARGKAEQEIQSAQGYATQRVNRARGDAKRFSAVQQEFAKAPEVTRARLYLEAMSEVLPKARRRVFIDDKIKGLVPLLPLHAPGASAKGTLP
ncbi:MAG: FtsH protease activity modulator HflK [Proteobacteria bacterium]|nr:FtsH protease activity modulator HflK [Pseudomonadota bacterium]